LETGHEAISSIRKPFRDAISGFGNPFQPIGFAFEITSGFLKKSGRSVKHFIDLQRKSLITLRRNRKTLNRKFTSSRKKCTFKEQFSKKNNAISRETVA
jgi:hypothetical protein